jgi:UDP-glucose 4-epimerase
MRPRVSIVIPAYNEGSEINDCVDRILELAEKIWHRIRGAGEPFRYVSDTPFEHDVHRRIPDTTKARAVLGFEATTSLDDMLEEVVPWIESAIGQGVI